MKMRLVFSLLLTVLVFNAHAKVWRVNNTTGIQADFTTIGAAISAAAAGDTIYVEGSATSYGGATISKKLIIIGPGYYLGEPGNTKTQWNQNPATLGQLIFSPGSAGTVCAGLYLNSSQRLNDQHLTIERCYVLQIIFGSGTDVNCDYDTVRQCVVGSFYCQPAAGSNFSAQGQMVYNNIIFGGVNFTAGMAGTSVYFINNHFVYGGNFVCQNSVFQNNIFDNAHFSSYGGSNYFANNIVTASASTSGITEGNNNQFSVALNTLMATTAPNFYYPPSGFSHDGQFQLAADSPAKGAGTINAVTVDCGAFGGAASYILSGMPNIPSIYALTVPNQVNNGTPTISISLSAAAH